MNQIVYLCENFHVIIAKNKSAVLLFRPEFLSYLKLIILARIVSVYGDLKSFENMVQVHDW